jgi:hypothetical protein
VTYNKARGVGRANDDAQVLLQTAFHGPLGYELVAPLPPIFTRTRLPTAAEAETGAAGAQRERSFYRNSYAMVRVCFPDVAYITAPVHKTPGASCMALTAVYPVYGPDVVPRAILLHRHQAEHHAPALALPVRGRPGRVCTGGAGASCAAIGAEAGDVAGEHCGGGAIHGWHWLKGRRRSMAVREGQGAAAARDAALMCITTTDGTVWESELL